MSIEWYAVHTYVGQEKMVEKNLKERASKMGMWYTKIYQVLQPSETATELQDGGKKVTVERLLFPGYVFVQMDIEDDDAPGELGESWEAVRGTPGVTGFVGTSTRPVPLSQDEVDRLLRSVGVMQAAEVAPVARVSVNFKEGDLVRVTAGPFADFSGVVSEVNIPQSKVKVLVSIFGRETPVELDFSQVQKG
ncbi:transcription termination/antitermination protein NusG [Deinococcus aquiradiocola]|uniref:Transcription termination/antitermination protein NusG n=1 Tax=Deinococcus aquiradiocola TaxID=393059 RepID=A0A917PEX1_9DEIO|nr:transcription termination/antitermination protein NusG [Deinococcus aquiradiocola]GGJ73769.1 transcription termination/antitermination protein NusG [Deinococcus aquiradiocola]